MTDIKLEIGQRVKFTAGRDPYGHQIKGCIGVARGSWPDDEPLWRRFMVGSNHGAGRPFYDVDTGDPFFLSFMEDGTFMGVELALFDGRTHDEHVASEKQIAERYGLDANTIIVEAR